MVFTYEPSEATDRDKVRFLIGDTDTSTATKQIFTDAELDMWSSDDVYTWAGKAMMAIAASRSRIATLIRASGTDFTVDR